MDHISPQELHGLHDQARRRAQQLRQAAIQDFWRGADAIWSARLDTAQRSARRLAYSLARHVRQREHGSEGG